MTEKDYSLLRPFDLEAAKAGAELTTGDLPDLLNYVAGPDEKGWLICKDEGGCFVFVGKDAAKALPLCWVEGKPVYPGDVLEHAKLGEVVAKSRHASREMLVVEKFDSLALGNLAWPRPKPVKRWINIYPCDYTENALSHGSWSSKDLADGRAMANRIACIEIELPPLKP